MMDIKRQFCKGGEQTVFTMEKEATAFFVSNYGPSTVFVCLDEWDESRSARIDPKYSRRIVANLNSGGVRPKTNTVIVTPLDEYGAEHAALIEVQRDD